MHKALLKSKRGQAKAGLWLALLWLAGLLAACGSEATVVVALPTPQSEAAILPFQPATPSPAVTSGPAPTPLPEATSTPVIVNSPLPPPTVTPEPPTATPDPPASTPLPTSTPEPPPPSPEPPTATPGNSPAPTGTPGTTPSRTVTPGRTAVPTRTPLPTPNLTPAALDAAHELKVIQAAYDAINKNYYTQPDTATVAQKALEEAATVLGLSPPASLVWSDPAANWKLFEQHFNQLVNASQLKLPRGQLAHRVANAMALAVGDLHTYFLDQRRSEAVQRLSRGDNTTLGFGVFYVLYQNGYYVQRLTTGAPGQLAGVKVGDRLVRFQGVEVTGANFAEINRSKEGSHYKFEFQRPGQPPPVVVELEFKRYKVPTVEWQLATPRIGHITINAFHMDVAARLDEAIAAVRQKGADSLVIDLRYNGGGYNFDRVAGRFVKDGEPLGKFVNRASSNSPLKARSEGKLVDPPLPLVVLIDRGSASASEIFSLAIRDYRVGTLIGNRSAGAIGTVRYWPLGDGTMLAVTNSVYETDRGEKLNGTGITPDVLVVRSTADILAGRDPQLEASIKHLESKAKAQP